MKEKHRFALRSLAIASLAFIIGSCAKNMGANGAPSQPTAEGAFFDDFTASSIDSSVWLVATWAEHGGQTGKERCFADSGYLTMQFINDDGTFLSSAIQTRDTFLYGRWEYRAKCSDVPGVLNSFYTIDWGTGDGTKQEIDIEFLTKSFSGNSGQIHYAVHAAGRTSFHTNPDIDLGFNPSSDFHVYAIDISPTRIQWLADGVVKKTYTYSEGDITIDSAYQLKLNFWSKVDWIGGPPESGTTCTYLIDWIKFTPAG